MTKYSYEFKKKVVEAYLHGEGGYEYLCKIYGVKALRNLEQWVAAYKQFGDEGLMRSRKNKNYVYNYIIIGSITKHTKDKSECCII